MYNLIKRFIFFGYFYEFSLQKHKEKIKNLRKTHDKKCGK